jgi:DNA helicase-2/ATP-dependent DNA helicase PcrA
MFPNWSGLDPKALNLGNPKKDYPAIREAAVNLLKGRHLSDILTASYDRLFVDEYQDCGLHQHAIVG